MRPPWSAEEAIVEAGDALVLRTPLLVRRGAIFIAVMGAFWAVWIINLIAKVPPGRTTEAVVAIVGTSLVFAGMFWLESRSIRAVLIATSERILIRNLYRTHVVDPKLIDRIALEWRPGYFGSSRTAMLHLRDGRRVPTDSIAGRKDENEGPTDLVTRQLVALQAYLREHCGNELSDELAGLGHAASRDR